MRGHGLPRPARPAGAVGLADDGSDLAARPGPHHRLPSGDDQAGPSGTHRPDHSREPTPRDQPVLEKRAAELPGDEDSTNRFHRREGRPGPDGPGDNTAQPASRMWVEVAGIPVSPERHDERDGAV